MKIAMKYSKTDINKLLSRRIGDNSAIAECENRIARRCRFLEIHDETG